LPQVGATKVDYYLIFAAVAPSRLGANAPAKTRFQKIAYISI